MNFTLLLVILLAITGVTLLGARFHERRTGGTRENRHGLVELVASLFPVVLVVLLIRSFVAEPFKIPSGSMLPTLRVGDFILVNKFEYGLRVPLVGWFITDWTDPERGDVIVFQYPRDPSVDYIKRVVAVPGDRLALRNHTLYVNGQPVPRELQGTFTFTTNNGRQERAERFQEELGSHNYSVLYSQTSSGRTVPRPVRVPEGEYFVMGDNRDNSNDSRYWGTVPEANILGEAFLIWWSWSWENGSLRWSRLGQLIP